MATLSLTEMVRLAGEQAHRILIERRDSALCAMYVLLSERTGKSAVLACPWHDEADKVAMLAEVRRAARQMQATAFSFLDEVWMTDTRSAPDALLIRPAEHPQRREYVVAYASDGKTIENRRWQIIRDKPGGSIIALVEEPCGTEIMLGRMLDVLPQVTP